MKLALPILLLAAFAVLSISGSAGLLRSSSLSASKQNAPQVASTTARTTVSASTQAAATKTASTEPRAERVETEKSEREEVSHTEVATTQVVAGATTTATTTQDYSVAPAVAFASAIEEAVHVRINSARAEHGLAAVSFSTRLASIARAHSADMLTNDYFEHENLSGCSSSCRATNAGYTWRAIGENIYMMSGYTQTADEAAKRIVDGWMASEGHRANILNATYVEEGIGVAVEGKTIYATELLGKPR